MSDRALRPFLNELGGYVPWLVLLVFVAGAAGLLLKFGIERLVTLLFRFLGKQRQPHNDIR
jgi:hypothetical protein